MLETAQKSYDLLKEYAGVKLQTRRGAQAIKWQGHQFDEAKVKKNIYGGGWTSKGNEVCFASSLQHIAGSHSKYFTWKPVPKVGKEKARLWIRRGISERIILPALLRDKDGARLHSAVAVDAILNGECYYDARGKYSTYFNVYATNIYIRYLQEYPNVVHLTLALHQDKGIPFLLAFYLGHSAAGDSYRTLLPVSRDVYGPPGQFLPYYLGMRDYLRLSRLCTDLPVGQQGPLYVVPIQNQFNLIASKKYPKLRGRQLSVKTILHPDVIEALEEGTEEEIIRAIEKAESKLVKAAA